MNILTGGGSSSKEQKCDAVATGAETAPKDGPEIGQMKKGDYMVHVYIQEGKQFMVEKANSDLCSPMIQITCGTKSKYTTCKKDVSKQSLVYWGEHLFFELNNVSKQEIESTQIQIRVLNKGFLKDELIGSYLFDSTYIYFQPKHTLYNSWLALSNPEGKDFNEINCYLRVALSITGPGDDQVALNDESIPHTSEEQEVMMPPQIRRQYKQLKLRFIKGERFPCMDMGGTIDAFLQTTYYKKKLATEPVTQSKTTHECLIEQEFWLPIQWPLASDRLVLKVYDKDPLKVEIVGSMHFSLKQMILESENAGPQGTLKWLNLYGSPLGCRGENTDKMNDYPEFASTWKGRILMQIQSTDTKNPELKKDKLTAELKTNLLKSGIYNYDEYEIIAEFGSGISLPAKKKYHIRIQINDFIVTSQKAKEQKGNYNRWSERVETVGFKGPYKSIEELGRVYVYLMDGDDPVCFWKGQASEFANPNPKYRWLPMQADLSFGKVTNAWEAGLVQLKLSINHKTRNGGVDFNKLDAWKKPPPKRLSSWKIRCYIFQCKDIPAADNDGQSDPFIKIWNPDDKKIQTQVIEDNINPIFFEALELYYDFDHIMNAPPIVLDLWDKDDLLDADDYLGRCVVYLTEASIAKDDTIPEPKWHDVRLGFSDRDPTCGQMLVSFSVVEDDYVFKIPISYLKLTEEIEYKEYQVEINVLGLRNLESFGLMPVKKPFVKFNLRSLLPPEKAQAVTNIKTQPSACGNNPNINTVLTFSIDLPVNPLFCPKLQCDVYDYVYKGLVQPLLGTFTISIGDIMHQEKQQRDEQLIQSDQIITFLKKRLSEIDSEPFLIHPAEALEEEAKEEAFQERMRKMNQLAADQTKDEAVNSSRLNTDTAIDKQRLISGENYNTQNIGGAAIGPEMPGEEGGLSPGGIEQEDISVSINDMSALEGVRSPFDGSQGQRFMRKKKTLGGNMFKQENKTQKQLEEALHHRLAEEKRFQKDQDRQRLVQARTVDLQKMRGQGEDAHRNVIYPRYEYDARLKMKREQRVGKPPCSSYMEVGYDREVPADGAHGNKHYRRYYDDELENIKELFPQKPFHQSDLVRGQSRGLSKSFFSWGFLAKRTDESDQVSTQKVVGYFKGLLHIQNEQEKAYFKETKASRMAIIWRYLEDIHQRKYGRSLGIGPQDLESFENSNKLQHVLEDMGCTPTLTPILSFLKTQSHQDLISKLLLTKTKTMVRLYVLEGFDFAQKDVGSFSDPYLKVRCGAKRFNDRDKYQLDEPNPKFHKCYEFDAEFPGAAPIVIKAYDYDALFGDDLIGTTTIDLDDRFFSPHWQEIEDKPIEQRSLYHPSSQIAQGSILCWVEIIPTSISTKGTAKQWDLTPQPLRDYELRLAIYDTLDIDCSSGDLEGTSDIFLKAFLDDTDKKETDCHYRCQNGKASFNYRLVYQLKAPRKNNLLTLQLWDRDLFKANDFLGEIQIPLTQIMEDAILTQKPIALNEKYYNSYLKEQLDRAKSTSRLNIEFYDSDSFYVTTYTSSGAVCGKVRIALNVTPGEMAVANPVGGGRSEPNHSPFLPPPVGRIKFSFNPIEIFNQMVGPELRKKVYSYCCLALCAALCIALLPMIASNLISTIILKIF